jgi:hypothetical protein
MKTFLEAIAQMEGFYVVGSRPQRNNNPGDLVYSSEAIRFGATGTDGRFAIFPDAETGWKALQGWFSVPARFDSSGNLIGGYLGATIEQAINRFAPPSENNTAGYVAFVANATGLSQDTLLTEDLLTLPV